MSKPTINFLKDPNSTLDYAIDWYLWLEDNENIVASEWEVPSGLVFEADAHNDSSTVVWVSGGTRNKIYELRNRITTSNNPPRIDDRTLKIMVRDR